MYLCIFSWLEYQDVLLTSMKGVHWSGSNTPNLVFKKSLINIGINEKLEWTKHNSVKYFIIWLILETWWIVKRISYEFRSNLNLPDDLNEKYIVNLHHVRFQFNSVIFSLTNENSTIFAYTCLHGNSFLPLKKLLLWWTALLAISDQTIIFKSICSETYNVSYPEIVICLG